MSITKFGYQQVRAQYSVNRLHLVSIQCVILEKRVSIVSYVSQRYTDRIELTAGTFVIGFNATAKYSVPSAAVAIDDVTLLEGSCSNQGALKLTDNR